MPIAAVRLSRRTPNFLRSCTFASILNVWRTTNAPAPALLEPLFTVIDYTHLGLDRPPQLDWWPRALHADLESELRRFLLRAPAYYGPCWALQLNQQLDTPHRALPLTVLALSARAADEAAVIQLLLLASLWCRRNDRGWQSRALDPCMAYGLEWLIRSEFPAHPPWHPQCGDVLPLTYRERDGVYEHAHPLIAHFAREHRRLLTDFELIEVVFRQTDLSPSGPILKRCGW